jgi:2-amino-4-hydroxy-6-hydroxymethyldihydropteridine diphosphokinase
MTRSFIALGSNLEEPLAQLQRGIRAIAKLPETSITAASGIYRSAAVGPGEQPDYLNAVLEVQTALAPLTLLDALQAIESLQGRVRGQRWAARTLDLDILLYGRGSLQLPRLVIPHPRMTERNFVLYPLLEISDPNLMLPGGAELGTLVAACPRGDLQRTELPLRPDGGDSDH